MLVNRIARIINRLLRPLGISINRVSSIRSSNSSQAAVAAVQLQYKFAIEELHNSLVDTRFPELSYVDGRFELMLQLQGTTISEATWILNALHQSLKVEGDICEFGVAHGATSALIANEIRHTDRNLWLFDSFEGLPKPTEKDILIDDILGLGSMEAYEGIFSYRESVVLNRLDKMGFPKSRTKVVKGFIEETVKTATLPETVAFAYIDFDFYEPILVGLNYLVEHMPAGGYIVVDDYGFFSSGAKTAVDEFVEAHKDSFEIDVPPQWARHFIVLHKIK